MNKRVLRLIVAPLILLLTIISVVFVSSASDFTSKIDLYYLDDYYLKYISIPDNFKQEYKLPLTGKKSDYYWDIDGETVSVSDNLVVKPAFDDDVVSIGLADLSTSTSKEYYPGKTIVKATSKNTGKKKTFEFNSCSYGKYYADKKMNDYIKSNIKSSMSDKQKLVKICEFVCKYPYHNKHSGAESMIVTGEGGDCWASADAIVKMAKMAGLKARLTEEGYVSMFSGGHIYPIVSVGEQYAIVEANIRGRVLIDNDKVYSCERSYSISYNDIPFAYSFYYDENSDEKKVQIDAYLGFGGEIAIPERIEGRNVTKIGEGCFSHSERYLDDDSKIIDVDLPDTIEVIDALAFNDCKKLKNVYIPASVKKIGRLAFGACSSLALDIDENNEYFYADNKSGILYSKDMTTLLFAYNLKEKKLKVPNKVKVIKDAAFWNEKLEAVSFPDTLEEIEYCAFAHCDFKNCDIVLPESVSALGYGAFYSTSPKSITIVNPNCVINNTKENDLCNKEDGETLGGETYSNTTVVYASKGSTAEKYVEKFGVKVIKWSDGTVDREKVYEFKQLCPSFLKTGTHSWGEEKSTRKATCTRNGRTVATCTQCGETKTGTVQKLGHNFSKWTVEVAATCTKNGLKSRYCTRCEEKDKSVVIKATGHKIKETVVKKAGFGSNGVLKEKCSVCNYSRTKIIPAVAAVKLSKTSFKYNGKKQVPSVAVYDKSNRQLVNGKDYSLSLPLKSTEVGIYSVIIRFEGFYSGTKKIAFQIVPCAVKGLSAKRSKSSIVASWKKVNEADKYKVSLYAGKELVRTVETTKTSIRFNKTDSSKRYKIVVSSFCNSGKIKLCSSAKSVKVN